MKTNEELLEIARSAKDKNIRRQAILKITDEKMLFDIAMNSSLQNTRKAAVDNDNFKNQVMLEKVAVNDHSHAVLNACIGKITNSHSLFRIFHHYRRVPYVRMECLRKMDLSNRKVAEMILYSPLSEAEFRYVVTRIDNLDYFSDNISRRLNYFIPKYFSEYICDEITDERYLCVIACYHPDDTAKSYAVHNSNLKDEKLMTYVMKHLQSHKYLRFRNYLCRKITDIDYLTYIAEYDPSSKIRKYAEEKILSLTGDAGIISEISKNNPKARLKQLENITDEQELIKIAKSDTNINVRKAAIDMISDKETLIDIAERDVDYCVSAEAMANIDDKKRLIEMFENRSLPTETRVEALKAINNQTYYFKIATTYYPGRGHTIEQENIRCAATRLITNQKQLVKIATENWKPVRMEAVKNPHLKNNEYLLKIIRTNTWKYTDGKLIAKTAINKMTNPKSLKLLLKDKEIAKRHSDNIERRMSELDKSRKK